MNKNSIYIGIMTGTSCDGIDISAISVDPISLKAHKTYSMPKKLQNKILEIITNNHASLSELEIINRELSEVIKNKISVFIKENKISKKRIIGIGLSGQTVRYQKYKKSFISMQLAEPNLISAYFKIPVIFDFRNSHISHGGMGAPLVKDFHIEVAGKVINKFAFINLGGIANYSVKKGASSWGTDTGPANALMDEYCKNYLNKSFDRDGAIASKGKIHEKIIDELMDHAFFKKKYPKTTGKEDFNLSIIPKKFLKKNKEDILATLCEFTAKSIFNALRKNNHLALKSYIVSGGGAKNKYLIERLNSYLDNKILSSEKIGLPVDAVESMAFAWLAYKKLNNIPTLIKTNNKTVKAVIGSISN